MLARKPHSGFTLLELLVVVAIMAIMLGLVGVNFNRNLDNVAHSEAKRFARVLKFTQEYSAYTGRILSLRLDNKNNTYYFLYVDPIKRSWNRLTPGSDNNLLAPHKVNEHVRLKLNTPKKQNNEGESTPAGEKGVTSSSAQIALITPFDDFKPGTLELKGETKNYFVTTDEYNDIAITIQ